MISSVNQDYLPSKKIFLLIAAIVILALGVYFYTTSGDTSSNNLVSLDERQELKQLDTDGDGLSDWEESLWGTDINNPDSDGDGTSDGDEVAQNRDPLTPGPDDSTGIPTTSTSSEAAQSPDRTTDLKAQMLPRALGLAAARQNGEDISVEDIGRVAASLDINQMLDVEIFSESDLNTIPGDSRADMERYVEETVRILTIESDQQRNPLSVLASELQDGGSEIIDLTPYITQMNTVMQQLQEVPVPSKYADDHVVVLNSAAKMKAGLDGMQYARSDPLSGVLGGQLYREALRTAEDAAERLSQRINQDTQ
jgi:hypothetical protein